MHLSEIIGAVFGLILLFFTTTGGLAMASAYSARTELSQIVAETAREMSAEGGFTQAVQQSLIQALQQNHLDPQQAEVLVQPDQFLPYGSTFSVGIAYPVPIHVAGVTAFDVVVKAEQQGVSLYPCTASCPNPPLIMNPPGQGTPDLAGSPQGGTGRWAGSS